MLKIIAIVIVAFIVLLAGCGTSPIQPPTTKATPESQSQPTTKPSPRSQFESQLEFVRNGQFTYIWVFSRKDGKVFDSEDGAYLRKNAPQVVDWVKADDEGKRFIGGTNFNLEEGNLELLKKRYVLEDHSAR